MFPVVTSFWRELLLFQMDIRNYRRQRPGNLQKGLIINYGEQFSADAKRTGF